MKDSKEYKISRVLFCVSILLFCVSIVTGLIPDLSSSVHRICMYLGFALLCLGFVLQKKAIDKFSDKD